MEKDAAKSTPAAKASTRGAEAPPRRGPGIDPLLELQSAAGNQAVLRLLQSRMIQAKLAVSHSADAYEQEADRVAEQVVSGPGGCACGSECPKCQAEQPGRGQKRLQAKPAAPGSPAPTAAPPIVHEALRSPGQPLDSATRAIMEPRLGHDFSQVRVHTGSAAAESARAVNAFAYTFGQHIVFDSGQYLPGSDQGKRLLAHELTHTVQQGDVGQGTDPLGQSVMSAGPSPLAGVIHRQPRSSGKSTKATRQPRITKVVLYKPSQAVFFLDDDTTATRAITRHCDPSPGNYRANKDKDFVVAGLKCLGEPVEGRSIFAIEGDTPGIYEGEFDFEVVSGELTQFLQSGKSGLSVPSDQAAKARVAAKMGAAGVTEDEMFDYREAADKPSRTWAEFEASMDRYLEKRQARAEEREATTRKLTGDLGETMMYIPDTSPQDAGRGLDEGMVDIYKDYQKLVRSSQLGGSVSKLFDFNRDYPGEYEKIARGPAAYATNLRASIVSQLQAFGIPTLDEFLNRVRAFEVAFRNYTVDYALDLLGKAEHVCHRYLVEVKQTEGTRNWDVKAVKMIKGLTPARPAIQSELSRLSAEARQVYAEKGPFSPELKPALATLEAGRKSTLDLVSLALPQFPFVAWPDFPREKLVNATDPADVMYFVGWYMLEHIAGIRDARERLQSGSKRIYKLDSLLDLSKKSRSISAGSIFDLIIRDEVSKASEESLLDSLKEALLFALMVVSIVVPGGVGIAAAAGSTILSAEQAVDMYKSYHEEHAEYLANLRSTDPSQAWVIISIIGAGLDAKGAIDLLAKSAPLRKAIEDFNRLGDPKQLSEELKAVTELNKEAREAIEQGAEQQVAKEAHAAKGGAEGRAKEAGAEKPAGAGEPRAGEVPAKPGDDTVLAQKEASPGHHVQVTPEGIKRCSPPPCSLIRRNYRKELADNPRLEEQLDYAERMRMVDPDLAAQEAVEVEKGLMRIRGEARRAKGSQRRVPEYERELDIVAPQPEAVDRARQQLTSDVQKLMPEGTSVSVVRTERTEAGLAQGQAARRQGEEYIPDVDIEIDLPDAVRREAGMPVPTGQNRRAGLFKPDDVRLLGKDGKTFAFGSHKEIQLADNSLYLDRTGYIKLQADMKRDLEVIRAINEEAGRKVCAGMFYSVGKSPADELLAQRIAEIADFLDPPGPGRLLFPPPLPNAPR